MIKTIRLLCGFMAIAMMAFVASCSDDDPNIGDGGSIPVADGFYISPVGGEPTEFNALNEELVELGFGTQERDGYYANYMFLTAGEYNLVTIVDQEFGSTFGGADSEADSVREKSDCDEYNAYTLVNDVVADGESFTVAESGLYYVGYDVSSTELFYTKIEVVNVIGAASPAGWSHSADQILMPEAAITATGASFKITEQVLRPGEWKIRFNCRWKIDRRTSTEDQADPTLGYNALVNLGGTFADPAVGGANFVVAEGEDGEYTIIVSWTPEGGWAMNVEKTLELAPITFNPSNYAWSITGAATSLGWPAGPGGTDGQDIDLNYEGESGGVYTWKIASVPLTADQFKFRANNDWTINFGFGGATLTGPDAGLLSDVGGNFSTSQAGNYEFRITTNDDGDTWTLYVDKL